MDLVKSGNASVPVCDPYTAASINVPYPFTGFCGPAFAAIAPYPQLGNLVAELTHDRARPLEQGGPPASFCFAKTWHVTDAMFDKLGASSAPFWPIPMSISTSSPR